MIIEFRNRAAAWLVAAVVLTGVVGASIYFRESLRPYSNEVLFILAYFTVALTAWYAWIAVGWNLAKAKGHDSRTSGGLLAVLFIASFCIPIAVFLFPIVVAFGLDDKTRSRRRH